MRLRTRFPLVVVGVLALLLGVAVILLWYLNIPAARVGGHDLGSFWLIGAWLVAGGSGLILGNRVAAVALSVPFAAVWLWWLGAAVSGGHVASALAAVVVGLVYLAPLGVTAAGWQLLGWRTWRRAA